DLIAGTYGRGIWILDDYAVLRQLTPALSSEPAHLFKPGLEEVSGLAAQRRCELAQHGIVIENPDAAPVGAGNEVIAVNREIAVRRHGQVEHERLPVVAIVE